MQAKKLLERRAAPISAEVGVRISDAEFEAFRRLIRAVAGISLSDSKRQLLCSRLAKRLRHLRLASFSEYYTYLKKHDPQGAERREMVNCITTNKTHFFREPHHFEFLSERVFPEIARRAGASEKRRLRIWSAGCSTGEEPYSIAITVAEQLKAPSLWDVKILASDIDTEVLRRAEAGEYSRDKLEELEDRDRERWFEPAEAGERELRVCDELRELVLFRRINLIDERWPINTRFDVIFCRNVTIYFDRETQERLYERFSRLLRPGGYLIAGHSENLSWLSQLFTPIGKTVYQLHPSAGASRPPAGSRAKSLRPLKPRAKPEPSSPAAETPTARQATVMSGDVHSSREPTKVRTLLGSCVAVCLHDPVVRVGGMNHFMLPEAAPGSLASTAYGVNAMELLINQLLALGAQRSRLVARVFGAANVLKNGQVRVPEANARFALEFLARDGIAVLEKRLGGDQPLRITFHTHSGEAEVRAVGEERERAASNDARHVLELQRNLNRPITAKEVLF